MGNYVKHEVDNTIVRDFARRTLENLKYIERHRSYEEVYEVTQLVNSLLGLLVFPKEEYWDKLRPVPLRDIRQLQIKQNRRLEECEDLRQLIRMMRNSISHFNLYFPEDTDVIRRLEMWNLYRGKKTWSATMDVYDLRGFIEYFINGIIDGSLLETDTATKEAK